MKLKIHPRCRKNLVWDHHFMSESIRKKDVARILRIREYHSPPWHILDFHEQIIHEDHILIVYWDF